MKIINKRISSKCEYYVSSSQYDFKKGIGTMEAIFSITITVEKYLEVKKHLSVLC